MTLVRRTNPFGELVSLRTAMDRLFEDSFVRPGNGASADRGLALDMYSTPDSFVVEAALPGVKPENVNITVLGDTLSISGNTSSEQTSDDEGYSYREIRRGSFSRTVSLPSGLKTDAAAATFENGLLRLAFPKAEEAKPRQIEIKPTTEGQAAQVEQGGPRPAGDATSEQPSGEQQS
jgi:HSP20 family protein